MTGIGFPWDDTTAPKWEGKTCRKNLYLVNKKYHGFPAHVPLKPTIHIRDYEAVTCQFQSTNMWRFAKKILGFWRSNMGMKRETDGWYWRHCQTWAQTQINCFFWITNPDIAKVLVHVGNIRYIVEMLQVSSSIEYLQIRDTTIEKKQRTSSQRKWFTFMYFLSLAASESASRGQFLGIHMEVSWNPGTIHFVWDFPL